MPLKQRNVVIDLGAVDAGDASPEVDLSSMTHCVLYMKPDPAVTLTSNRAIHVECCPLPPGETAADEDWHQLYGWEFFGSIGSSAQPTKIEWLYTDTDTTQTQVSPIPNSAVLTGSFYGYTISMTASPRRIRFVLPELPPASPGGFNAANLTVEGMRSIG